VSNEKGNVSSPAIAEVERKYNCVIYDPRHDKKDAPTTVLVVKFVNPIDESVIVALGFRIGRIWSMRFLQVLLDKSLELETDATVQHTPTQRGATRKHQIERLRNSQTEIARDVAV